MKIKIIFPFLLLILTVTGSELHSQEFLWAKKAGYYAFDYGYGICADDAGNVYVSGKYEMDSRFDDVTVSCEGNHDIFTAKYDPEGNLLWVRTGGGTWGDYAHAMTCDGAGNVYITGEIEMEVVFQHSDITLSSWGSNDMFVAKYNTHGELLWAHRGGGRESDQGLGIEIYGDAVYVVGKFKDTAMFGDGSVKISSAGDDDIYLAKYDTAGNFKWVKRAGGKEEDEGLGVSVDAEGYIYITGYFEEEAEFSGVQLKSNGKKDIFIAKYDPEGNLKWVKNAGGKKSDMGTSIKAAPDGRIYITGGFRENSSWGNIHLTAKKGDTDIFTACYTKDGEAVWVKKAGGDINDRGQAITADQYSNVYVTGYFGYYADFGSETITGADSADIFIVKYTSEGELKWVMKVDGEKDHSYKMGTEESGRAIWVDNQDNVLVTGSFRTDAVFGDIYLKGWMHTDIFIAKIEQDPEEDKGTNIINPDSFIKNFSLYPNPAEGFINILYSGDQNQIVKIQIQSTDGRTVLTRQFNVSGQHLETIELGNISKGMYFLNLSSGGKQVVKKMVVR